MVNQIALRDFLSNPQIMKDTLELIEIIDPQTQVTFYIDTMSGTVYSELPANAVLKEKDANQDEWWELFDAVRNLVCTFSSVILLQFQNKRNRLVTTIAWTRDSIEICPGLSSINIRILGKMYQPHKQRLKISKQKFQRAVRSIRLKSCP